MQRNIADIYGVIAVDEERLINVRGGIGLGIINKECRAVFALVRRDIHHGSGSAIHRTQSKAFKERGILIHQRNSSPTAPATVRAPSISGICRDVSRSPQRIGPNKNGSSASAAGQVAQRIIAIGADHAVQRQRPVNRQHQCAAAGAARSILVVVAMRAAATAGSRHIRFGPLIINRSRGCAVPIKARTAAMTGARAIILPVYSGARPFAARRIDSAGVPLPVRRDVCAVGDRKIARQDGHAPAYPGARAIGILHVGSPAGYHRTAHDVKHRRHIHRTPPVNRQRAALMHRQRAQGDRRIAFHKKMLINICAIISYRAIQKDNRSHLARCRDPYAPHRRTIRKTGIGGRIAVIHGHPATGPATAFHPGSVSAISRKAAAPAQRTGGDPQRAPRATTRPCPRRGVPVGRDRPVQTK